MVSKNVFKFETTVYLGFSSRSSSGRGAGIFLMEHMLTFRNFQKFDTHPSPLRMKEQKSTMVLFDPPTPPFYEKF